MTKKKYEKIAEGSYGVYRKKKDDDWLAWVGGFLLLMIFIGLMS